MSAIGRMRAVRKAGSRHLMALLVCCAVAGACSDAGGLPGSAAEAERLVRSELGEQADVTAVTAFLNERGIAHVYAKSERRIVSTSTGALGTMSIQMTFTFDAQGRLESFNARDVYSGP